MIDHLKSIAVFAIAVQERSFRGAARRLDLSPSVISHHVSGLEQRLGVTLIYRSTRSFSLTADGERFYESARTMMAAASDGIGAFADQSDARLAQLRIAIPQTLTSHSVFDRITAFARKNSGVQIVLNSSDTTVDLVRETIDVAIRIGRLADSEFLARKIGEDDLVIVASSDYVKSRKRPKHPNDLASWDFIAFTPAMSDIEFSKGSKYIQPSFGRPAAITDSIQVRCQLARAGVGLAGLPRTLIADDLKRGHLCDVLPGWKTRTLGIYLVWHRTTRPESVTRRFIDFVASG